MPTNVAKMRLKRHWVRGVLISSVAIGALSACVAFYAHEDLENILGSEREKLSLVADQFLVSAQKFPTNTLLFQQEAGRMYLLAKKPYAAQQALLPVVMQYRQRDFDAVISAQNIAQQTAATTFSNDQIIQYDGSDFERVFAHHYMAMAYLAQNNVDDALIELRAVRFAQQRIAALRQDEVMSAQFRAQEAQMRETGFGSEDYDRLQLDSRRAFLNLYTYLFTAAAFEAVGEVNEALVDYRKAYDIDPDLAFAQAGIARLGKNIVPDLVATFDSAPEPNPDHGLLLMFYEEGHVPSRQSRSKRYYTRNGNSYLIAWPHYPMLPRFSPYQTLGTIVPENIRPSLAMEQLTRFPLEDVMQTFPLAADQLRQVMHGIILRQIARATFQSAVFSGDSSGSILLKALSEISVRGDTRTWLSLPNRVQAHALSLPAGEYRVNAAPGGATFADTFLWEEVMFEPITIHPGRVHVVVWANLGQTHGAILNFPASARAQDPPLSLPEDSGTEVQPNAPGENQ